MAEPDLTYTNKNGQKVERRITYTSTEGAGTSKARIGSGAINVEDKVIHTEDGVKLVGSVPDKATLDYTLGSGKIKSAPVTIQSVQTLEKQDAGDPLIALSKTSRLPTINYPTDLSTNPQRSHYVQFYMRRVTPGTYNSGTPSRNIGTFDNALGVVKKTMSAAAAQASGYAHIIGTTNLGQTIKNSTLFNNAAEKVAFYASNPAFQEATSQVGEAVEGGGAVINTVATTGLTIEPPTDISQAYISLYMPDTLTAQYNADYTKVDLRADMGSTIRKIQTIESVAKVGKDATSLKQLFGSESVNPAVLERVFNTTKRFGATQNFSDVLLQGQGYTVNPQMQMLYQGLGFRSFSLSFIFTPTTKKEADDVKTIIYLFKEAAAPRLSNASESAAKNMYLVPPDIFNVRFYWKDIENEYLPRYGDCVLENIDVNYAPNGWAAHGQDGSPLQTTLNLTFKEIEIVDKERLQTGYGSPQDASGLR